MDFEEKWEVPEVGFFIKEQFIEYTSRLQELIGVSFSKIIEEYRNGVHRGYLNSIEWNKCDKALFDWVKNNPSKAIERNEFIEECCWEYLAFQDEKLIGKDFSSLSNNELAAFYAQFIAIMLKTHNSGQLWNVLENENQLLSGYLTKFIYDKIRDRKTALRACHVLLTPTKQTLTEKLNEELNELVANNRNLDSFFKKYEWTSYNYLGPAMTRAQFNEQVGKLKINPAPLVDLTTVREEQELLLKKMNADELHRKLFEIAQGILFAKAIRKETVWRGCWACENLYKEIASRLDLSLNQVRYLTKEEVMLAFDNKFSKQDCAKIANQRLKLCVIVIQGSNETQYLGPDAQKFLDSAQIKKITVTGNQLVGQTAYPGKIIGVAKIVRATSDIPKVNEGDIIVSTATSPNLLPAMHKAAGFVTDMGGITCHAAIVSREMRKPCVIGTKVATKLFKDGDKIELDADNAIVRKLN